MLIGDSSSTTAAATRRSSDPPECEGFLEVCIDGAGELEYKTKVTQGEVGGLQLLDGLGSRSQCWVDGESRC